MYGKVFESIYDGTLAGHWQAIVTMQQLIVLADEDGVVDMTPEALSRRTTIPLKIIAAGLEHLSNPDPYTRTPGEEGRRIVLLDDHRPWGWRLVNHSKYRGLRNTEQKREADRQRLAEKRNKNKDVAIASLTVANVAHTEAEAEAVRKPPLSPLPLPAGVTVEDWRAFRDHRTKLRKPMTPRAEQLALDKLIGLAGQGYDAKKTLNHAIEAGWQTFFPRDDCMAEVKPAERARAESCPCGAQGTVKVGGKWRCSAHVRTDFSTAARAA